MSLAFLAACAAGEDTLNSERIEARFGSYGIELLPAEPGIRRASLYSQHGADRICRTYAVVRLQPLPAGTGDDALEAAHADIVDGASIGATLEASGWEVLKRTRYLGALPAFVPPPGWLARMHVDATAGLAVHVYRLDIKNHSETIEYAQIIEVHHPAYLDPSRLAALYRVPAADALDAAGLEAVYALLTGAD